MQIEQHSRELPIDNFDEFEESKKCIKKHGDLFPSSCRFLICGPSGCGKSNAFLALLFHHNGLRFENVYIFSKSLYQSKYKLLEEVLNHVDGVGYHPYTENDEIVDPAEAKENSVFIFDDIACDKQNMIRAYYSMGRHKAIDVAYLCQTYSRVPKQLIRDNSNIICLFKQDDLNLKHAFDEHVSPDMSYDCFKELCALCWNHSLHGFLVVVKDFPLHEGRYRIAFDKFIKVKDSKN